jgi:hypothetical protein
MLARHEAVAELTLWGCQKGVPWAIKKAVSHGANVDVIRNPYPKGRRRYFTTTAAHDNLDKIRLLLDLGPRLDSDEDRARRILRTHIFTPDRRKILQAVLDHGGQDQIEYFQTGLDRCLFNAVNAMFRSRERPEGWTKLAYKRCQAWLAYGGQTLPDCSRTRQRQLLKELSLTKKLG